MSDIAKLHCKLVMTDEHGNELDRAEALNHYEITLKGWEEMAEELEQERGHCKKLVWECEEKDKEIKRLKEMVWRHNEVLWDGCPAEYNLHMCQWYEGCEMREAFENGEDTEGLHCSLQEYLELERDAPTAQKGGSNANQA
jgi:hypothetical protein